jgi:hypothetical protein
MFKSPRALLKTYRLGFEGALCDPVDVDRLLGELPHPLFGAAAWGLEESGDGKLSLPFKSLLKFDPEFGPLERQTTGDCVSHAVRNAIDITRSVEIDNGEAESFIVRGATEPIYGSREHVGQGMHCSKAARFVHSTGGILLRQKYPELDLDFSIYNSEIGTKWGRPGVPKNVREEGQKHQVQTVSLVTTVKEARDALFHGYALAVCSDQGFSSKRDKNGIAKASGTWHHAMCWCAVDDTREVFKETLFLVQNSWGLWNSGEKRHDQPDGSFWIRERVAQKMLGQRGAWVFSNVDGFPARTLPDYGTSDFL